MSVAVSEKAKVADSFGSIEERNAYIVKQMPLAQAFARGYLHRSLRIGIDYDELESIAFEALTIAAETFNPSLGYQFSTIFWKIAKNRLIKEYHRLGTHKRGEHGKVRVRSTVNRETQKTIDVADYRQSEGVCLESIELVNIALSVLNDRERYIVSEIVISNMMLGDVGKVLGVTGSRVGFVRDAALEKCRRKLEHRL